MECAEISDKIGDWLAIRVVIVDPQTAAHVEMAELHAFRSEPCSDFVDLSGQFGERFQFPDLRPDVKMQSENANVLHGVQFGQGCIDFGIGDAELALRLPGRNVMVCMGTNIRIDSQGYIHLFSQSACQLVDHLEFLQGFTVEGENALTDGVFDLAVTFSDSCEDDLRGMESIFYCTFHFITAHTIRS